MGQGYEIKQSGTLMLQERSTKLDHMVLFFMLLCFSLQLTTWKLPGGEILRWTAMCIVGIYGLIKPKVSLWNPIFFFIMLAMLPSISVMLTSQYQLQRFLSFLLCLLSLTWFFSRRNVTLKHLEAYFNEYVFLLYLLMTANFITLIFGIGFNPSNGRFYGIYSSANNVSPLSVFTFVCALYRFKTSRYQWLHAVFAGISFVCALLAASRVGFITLAISLGAYPMLFVKRKGSVGNLQRIIYVLLLMMIGFFILSYVPIGGLQRIREQGLLREDVWPVGEALFEMKPLFGWGYGAIGYYTFYAPWEAPVFAYQWGIHNSYLLIAIETGIWGLFFLGLFLIFAFSKIWMGYQRAEDNQQLFIKINLLLLANLLINAIAEAFLFGVGSALSLSVWFLLVLILAYVRVLATQSKKGGSWR